jgi:alanyl-tRNA synthetase
VNSNEIREAFLKFFEEKGHKVIPSSSLIPKGDPTLLLTTAGMVQVKPYFLGEAVPPSRRLASCQKCFRTTDIESVGDATHLTFFEMLGNFSVGDYFKKEAIAWAWEFVTERMKISPEKLWITIYLDDDESFRYWRDIGVPEAKIVRFGEEDNFWGPAGNSGPCGPCSEIHYDFGVEKGCGKPDCRPNCECGRFTEVWNLVFTQYNQDEAGQRAPLPKPNIDTGMGLERLVAVMAGTDNVYDTDLFAPLLDGVSGLTGKKYGANVEDDNAMRVVAEHGRALAFLIADGVIPGNEGRGYVLRRLLRRAALYGRRLGLDKPFLSGIAQAAIKKMSRVYPELKQRQDFINKVIQLEETRFEETLKTGLEIIDSIMSRKATKKTGQISGGDAFRLYDTYGFPVELTKEIVSKSGFSVDMAGFEEEMEKQRERARAGLLRCAECGTRLKESDEKCPNCGSIRKTRGPIIFNVEVKDGIKLSDTVDIQVTKFVGYHHLEQKANIVRLLVDGKEADTIEAGQSASIILDTTPFYGEMGGQVGDTGEIVASTGKFLVTDTVRLPPDITMQRGKITEGYLLVGEEVTALVDVERRADIARNHTATHLLQAALRQVLGEHIQQRGSLVAPERLRFDFSHLAAMTPDEIKAVQRIVNEKIRENLRVYDEETDYKKAIAAGVIALFDEKYGDVVRVMRIGEPVVSAELCGGTHVSFTGEIGYFHITSEGSIGAGLRRIEAVTGREAERFIERRLSGLEGIAQSLESTPEEVPDKVTGLVTELDRERKLVLSLERELAKKEAESLVNRVESVKGVNVLSARVTSANQQILREMADLIRDKLESVIVVLGAISGGRPVFIAAVTPDLVAKGYNAGDIIRQVSKLTGGGGGGKANFAQGSGKFKDRLDEALRLVRDLI